jgi:hypothetical protein
MAILRSKQTQGRAGARAAPLSRTCMKGKESVSSGTHGPVARGFGQFEKSVLERQEQREKWERAVRRGKAKGQRRT